MNATWSYILAVGGMTALWLAANKPLIGWRMSIAVQALWLAYAIATQQWGFVVTCIGYSVMYARLLKKAAPAQAVTVAEDRHA